MADRDRPWDSIELAKAAKVTDAYIRRLCIDGKIPGAYKAGRIWLIPAEAGQAWLDKRNERWVRF